MIRVDLIIDDFMDLRAYVSHTLLLHRLTLGMSSLESAISRLSDASIWPFVSREIERFCDLAPTLYGIDSRPIDKLLFDIKKKNVELTALRDDLVKNKNDSALEPFYDLASKEIHELFVKVRAVWRDEVPDFSESACKEALEDLPPEHWIENFRKGIQSDIVSVVESLIQSDDEHQAEESYRRYWEIIEDIFVLSRKAIVASIIFGGWKDLFPVIRNLQRLLRQSEEIVSCWSSNISSESRPQVLAERLQAQGVSSKDQLIKQLRQAERT